MIEGAEEGGKVEERFGGDKNENVWKEGVKTEGGRGEEAKRKKGDL